MLKIFFWGGLLMAVGTWSVESAEAGGTAVAGDAIVARGRGFEIRRKAIDQVLATARLGEAQANAALGRTNSAQIELPPDAEIRVLDQLIEIQLVLQKTTAAEMAAAKQKTDETFTNIINTMGEALFEEQLRTTLMTADDLRLMLFQEEAAQASLARQLGINVTDTDARAYFENNPGAFDEPEKVRIRELLLLTTSDFTTSAAPWLPQATVQTKHDLIFELHRRACAGADVSALARQYNEDPISKGNDGELTFKRDQMEFDDLAFSLQTGQISEVVTNTEGFRFFQLLGKIPAHKAEFAALAGKLKLRLTGEQKRRLAPDYITRLRKEAKVEILDPQLKAAQATAEAELAEATRARAVFLTRQAAESTNTIPRKP